MNRNEFLKRFMRYALFAILTLIVLLLGKKAVTGAGCYSCPGKGICNGETDCSKF